MFSRLVDKMGSLRVLLFVTFRPEFTAPWVGRAHVTLVTINRLTAREVAAVIDRVAGARPLAESIRHDIVERADGIPLFAEEMTKAVLEAEGEGAAARAIASVPSPALAVPASLHASLMARLDRLGPAKAIAQIGAAIGAGVFPFTLLTFVAGLPDQELGRRSTGSFSPGSCRGRARRQNLTYLFKHVFVQDAALRHAAARAPPGAACSDRRRPGASIPQRHGDPAGAVGASLHSGGADREGGGPLGQSGRASVGSLGAFGGRDAADPRAGRDRRVAGHAGAASRADRTSSRPRERTLMHLRGYAAAETKASLDQARALIAPAEALHEPSDDPLTLFSVIYAGVLAHYVTFDCKLLHELAVQVLELANRQTATAPLCLGHRAMGLSLLHEGDVVAAKSTF